MLSQFFKTTSLSTDLVVLGIIFIIFFLYALYFGRGRIISFLLSFYPAIFLYDHFPFMSKLLVLHGDQMILLNKVLIFLLFLIPLDIIINRFIFSQTAGGTEHFLRTAGLALCAVILVLVFSYTTVSFNMLYDFSGTIDGLFAPDKIFWWTVAPLVLMFFL